jgi:hypothetical protein
VLLFRGGDHIYEAARDTPDILVTPLKYAFGLNAFTIKSEEPGHYADAIARYIQRWQSEGRQVYLVVGASGAVGLPNMQLTPVGKMALHLHEFEQLTIQKPSNVQDFGLDFKVYRLGSSAQPAFSAIKVDDYAAQVQGFYHPEQIDTTDLVWTDGDALLRLPWPRSSTPQTVTINLASGKRPTKLGPAQVCLSIRPEMSFWV